VQNGVVHSRENFGVHAPRLIRIDAHDPDRVSPEAPLKYGPELQLGIMQLEREGSPPPGLRLPQAKLSRKSNQVARGRIRRFAIGAGWCQALSDCSVDLRYDITRRVLASLRDRHLGPLMMGSGGCGGPIYRGVLAVRLTAGIRIRNGLASSIVPTGTSLRWSAEFTFSPVGFYCEQLAVRYMSVISVH
jgi:hypothetical protein